MHNILLIFFIFIFKNTLSFVLLDDFSDCEIESTKINLSNLGFDVERKTNISFFDFPYPFRGVLHYQTASNEFSGSGIIQYSFKNKLNSSLGINFSEGSLCKFNFLKISYPFILKATYTDKKLRRCAALLKCQPEKLNYEINKNDLYQIENIDKRYSNFCNIHDIGYLTLEFNSPTWDSNHLVEELTENLEFDLDSIEIVPEPISLFIMGIPMSIFVRKKLKKTF